MMYLSAMQCKIALIFLILALNPLSKASAGELPSPGELIRKYQIPTQSIQVVEPHESTPQKSVLVSYTAVPLKTLLTDLFGKRWQANGSRIIFFAKDGYRTVIPKTKLVRFNAYLAFARDDDKPFTVDNIAQGEKQVSLAPYYLVWDNMNTPELLRHGAYGWPYQVNKIELATKADNWVLQPNNDKAFTQGVQETENYCLTCHAIKGVGGRKYSVDLIQASCGFDEQALHKWIDMPSVVKPGTSMPALNRMLPNRERQAVIARIVAYLKAMKNEPTSPCMAR